MGCVQSTAHHTDAPKGLESTPHACAHARQQVTIKDVDCVSPANGVSHVHASDLAERTTAKLTAVSQKSGACPHLRQEQHAGVSVQVNRCPFGHGSVGAGPFPGYVHGGNPTICKEGCKPDPDLGKYGRLNETPRQTLVREALEFQELYHKDKDLPADVKRARVQEILAEIEATGTYKQTFDELQHGARVAWRNAPKCSNRKFWEELQLIDARDAKTPTEMFETCLDLLEKASVSCVTTANIAVFRPQTPGTADGPRVWNTQLIRFAGYPVAGSERTLGDPAEKDFTELVMKDYGWKPPNGAPGRFDVLPLLLQTHPTESPQLFEIPSQYVVRVPIRHPTNERISALGLQWYAVPAVSCLELSVGGLTYTAAPFNGWYADTEIVRNLTDSNRLNLCAEIASCLGLETKNDTTMWRDRAIVEANVAVMHSFREAGMGMVDHHTLMRNFFNWWHKEKRTRGYSPGNWKWIIPPVSPTANISCYLHLNKMTEYTVKPGYWYAPGWRKYLEQMQGPAKDTAADPASPAATAKPMLSKTVSSRIQQWSSSQRVQVVLAYATITGNTQQFAEAVTKALENSGKIQVLLLNMEDFESDSWAEVLGAATVVLLLTSTYGPGAPPGTSAKFMNWLAHPNGEAESVLDGKPFSVLGFGSSSYPRFCAAAELMHTTMLALGASAIMPVAKADALAGEEGVVWPWVKMLSDKMLAKGWLDGDAAALLVQHLPMNSSDEPTPWTPKYNLCILKGEGLQAAREQGCHWATVVESRELLGTTPNEASTRFLRFCIDNVPCGSYYCGDEVAVWAENPEDQVLEYATKLGLTEETIQDMFLMQQIQDESDTDSDTANFANFPLPNTFRTILTRHIGLTERIQFSALSALAPCAPEDTKLQELAASYNAYSNWASDVMPRWLDLFKLFPALIGRIPLATFFTVAPQVKPRYYSISSSSAVNPGEVAICVGLLKYQLSTGEQRRGFCSSFLTTLQPGSRVRFKLVSQPAFRMPFNLAGPVIMVAAGTGIAPFRGFWEERILRLQQQQQLGPSVLLFGCRSRQIDYLFQETLDAVTKMGAVSKILTAFSREKGIPKTYVQDLIQQRADDLKPLLLHPRCHVYVCGSSNMAQEVSRAFSKLAGKQMYDAIVSEGRYHEDVFGMNVTNHQAAAKAAQRNITIKNYAALPLAEVLTKFDQGLDLNAADETGSTLLHYACANNRLDLATALLTRGAAASPVNIYGVTPTAEAALAGHSTVVAVLETMGAKKVDPLHQNFYPLHAAVMAGDLQELEKILEQGMDPSQRDFQTVTPLHIAVVLNNASAAQRLLAAGADPNSQNRMGMTPLQLAVSHNRPELAALLTEAGATMKASHIVTAGAGMFNAESSTELQSRGVSPDDVARVRASWSLASGEAYPERVQAVLEEVGVKLFLALFDMYPHLLALFPFKDDEGKPILQELRVHGQKVASVLGEVVERLQNMEAMDRYVTDLVERHIKYGVKLVHYDIILGAIRSLLGQLLQTKLTTEDLAAWDRVLGLIKSAAQREYASINKDA